MAEHQDHQPKSFGVQDAMFILLRHKWKIAICGTMGVLAAAGLYFSINPGYEATAKLLVRYVAESSSPVPGGVEQSVMSTAGRRENILVAEGHIITSLDIATEVAENVGPGRILMDEEQATNVTAAVHAVAQGLRVDIPHQQTRILAVRFAHPNPETARVVLQEILNRYMERHLELHRAIGAYEFLSRQTDRLRAQLAQTDEELRRLKNKANIFSLEDSKVAINVRLKETKSALDAAEAELAAREERVRQWTEIAQAGEAGSETNSPATLDPDVVAEYRLILQVLNELKQKHQKYSGVYTESNALVRLAKQQIDDQLSKKSAFEQEHPAVAGSVLMGSSGGSGSLANPTLERAEVAALKAKAQKLRAQYEDAVKEAETYASVETEILKLERRRSLDEENYRNFSASLEQARIDEALDPSKMPNISSVQKPTVSRASTGDMKKKCLILVVAGFAVGIGLAFLIELVLDQTYKRAEDVESELPLPILLSIPQLSGQGLPVSSRKGRQGRLPWPFRRRRRVGARTAAGGNGDLALVSQAEAANAGLKAYCDAVRDRMMLFFQLKKMVHKPKLVAVAGCSAGAGGSTLAKGLAASLSETGAGKVLLVDMNLGRGAVQPFYRGGPETALRPRGEDEQLDEQKVTENLYVASPEDSQHHQALMLPKRFGNLIPRMRASDYDYIIFDMPPVSQTAATLTLSSFMDQALLVIEAGKSPKETVRKASSLLQQSGTNVFGVFNKSTSTTGGWLQPRL